MKFVSFIQSFLISIQSIRIFHNKLSSSDYARTWPGFITEFSLNLIPYLGKIFIGFNKISGKVTDYFFMSWCQNKSPVFSIFQTKHTFAKITVSSSLIPYFHGVQNWKLNFLCTNTVHFFSNNRHGFSHSSPP